MLNVLFVPGKRLQVYIDVETHYNLNTTTEGVLHLATPSKIDIDFSTPKKCTIECIQENITCTEVNVKKRFIAVKHALLLSQPIS